jgi:hypothetical protein
MKLASSLLLLALTAGLAALAATSVKHEVVTTGDVRLEDVDAWFV